MSLTHDRLRQIIKEEYELALMLETTSYDEDVDEGVLDWVQGGLDVVGLIPGLAVGEAADGLNAVISVARGNPLEALFSLISIIPVAGDAVGKSGKVALKILDPAMDVIKHADKFKDSAEMAAKLATKIDPDKLSKLKGLIGPIKNALVNNQDTIQKVFKAVSEVDLGVVEDIAGFKIPDAIKSKAEATIKEKMGSIDADGIKNAIKFFSEFSTGDEGGESEEAGESAEGEEKAMAAEGVQRLTEHQVRQRLTSLADYIGTFAPGHPAATDRAIVQYQMKRMIQEEMEGVALDELWGFGRKKKEPELPEKLLVQHDPKFSWDKDKITYPADADKKTIRTLMRRIPIGWQPAILDLVVPSAYPWPRMTGTYLRPASQELRDYQKNSPGTKDPLEYLLDHEKHGEQIYAELKNILAVLAKMPAETDGKRTSWYDFKDALDDQGWSIGSRPKFTK